MSVEIGTRWGELWGESLAIIPHRPLIICVSRSCCSVFISDEIQVKVDRELTWLGPIPCEQAKPSHRAGEGAGLQV